METVNQLFCFILNSCVACLVVIMISKWCSRIEKKQGETKDYLEYIVYRNSVIYINVLELLKIRLSEEGRYEEAEKIKECINEELKLLNKNG